MLIFVETNKEKYTYMKIENIASTEFNREVNILILDSVPTIEEQKELFTDDSIVLEF